MCIRDRLSTQTKATVDGKATKCTQKFCAQNEGGEPLSGRTIEVSQHDIVVTSCVTGKDGCCEVQLNQGEEYTASVLSTGGANGVTFTACTDPIVINVLE